jgi:dsDNA-specific endonuclease/ATPase MutS2
LEFEKVRRMILRWTFSALGRELAAGLTPDLEHEEIVLSQERIAEWKRLELKGEGPVASEVPDLRPLLARLRRGSGALDAAQLFHFLPLLEHLGALRRLLDTARARPEYAPRLLEILMRVGDFTGIRVRVRRSIGPGGGRRIFSRVSACAWRSTGRTPS